MSKHWKSPSPVTNEDEIVESSHGDYQPGELTAQGYCRSCGRGPYHRAIEIGFCPVCEEV